MRISVNGEIREVAGRLTVAELLEQLKVRLPHVAVEVNGELVPRAQHTDTVVSEGDELEIMTLVGGG